MKREDEPITPDEFVIRAIWTGFYNPQNPLPILATAFRPRPDETDGISVFRAACVAKPEDVLVVFAEDKRDKYALALLPVAELLKLGLTVEPAKIEATPGHAVLPELNCTAVSSDKAKWREIQNKLAELANANLVRAPV